MQIQLLATGIIMLLLIVFAVLILKSLAGTADAHIRADMLRLLRAYDDLIDRKGEEIERLNREYEGLIGSIQPAEPPEKHVAVQEAEKILPSGAVVQRRVNYRAPVFGMSYGAVRRHFYMDDKERSQLIQEVEETEPEEDGRGRTAAALLENLGFETVFRLAQQPPDEQLELLEDTLRDEDRALLEDYCGEKPEEPFDITGFTDWLRVLVALEGETISVRTGDIWVSQEQDFDYHQQICEGLEIRLRNHLYDYGIKEREIS